MQDSSDRRHRRRVPRPVPRAEVRRAAASRSWSRWSTRTQRRASGWRRRPVAAPVADYREILGEVDAVSIATPTPLHYPIAPRVPRARRARAGGEADHRRRSRKPASWSRLAARARRACCRSATSSGSMPRSWRSPARCARRASSSRIDSRRSSERGTDVNVVLDLMIHDIDLIQSLVRRADRLDRRGRRLRVLRRASTSPTPASATRTAASPTRRPAASA